MRKKIKSFAAFFAAVMLCVPGNSVYAAEQPVKEEELKVSEEADQIPEENVIIEELESEEIESEDLDYVQGRPLTEAEIDHQKKLETGLVEVSNLGDAIESPYGGRKARSALPAAYDSRDYGYVTAAKDQTPYGACWAFSANAMAETSLIKENISVEGTLPAADRTDLSELHTAYYFYHKTGDALGLTTGDRNIPLQSDRFLDNGGNTLLTAFSFANWIGTESEADAPYSWGEDAGKYLSAEQAYSADAKLRQARFVAGELDQLKAAVMEYGALECMYYHDDVYYNYDTAAYCYNGAESMVTNHVITLIGWDDSYSKENFAPESQVENDGAWIVKNNWGSDWGDGGFFYMSYEDTSAVNFVAMQFQDKETYHYNYQYDGSSLPTAFKTGKDQGIANVYQAGVPDVGREGLKAVSFAMQSVNVDYSIQIYTNLQDPSDPVSGKPALSTSITGVTDYAGIYTVDLPKVVYLQPGTSFSVVISLPNGGSYYAETSKEYDWIGAEAQTTPGQSFWKNSFGEWQDLDGYNICARIKAYTKLSLEKPALTVKSKGSTAAALSWDKVEGATGYRIYRSTQKNSGYSAIRNLKDPDILTYTNGGLKEGETYYYKMRTFREENGKTYYSAYTKPMAVTVKRQLATPSFTPTVTKNTARKAFVVTSSTVKDADGWEVQYSISDDWWRATLKDFPNTGTKLYRKTCTTVHSNRTYYIRVRGYQNVNGQKVYSDWSSTKTIKTK